MKPKNVFLCREVFHVSREELAKMFSPLPPSVPPVNPPPPPLPDGRENWPLLHLRALENEAAPDPAAVLAFLDEFALRLPCGNCRQHWLGMVAASPPDLANFFSWTVARHNEVNRRLDRPELPEADAREQWQNAAQAAKAAKSRPETD